MHSRPLPRSRHGFTLVELVATIVILGILAVVALPRFANMADYDEATYRNSVVSVVSLARQRALASRRFVCVNVAAGTGTSAGISLAVDPVLPESAAANSLTCSVPLQLTGYPECSPGLACPKSATVSGGSFAFDPQGRPVNALTKTVLAAPVSISISNQAAVTIQPRTGYAS